MMRTFFLYVMVAMIFGVIIVVLKQTVFNKSYKPQKLTKEREKELSKDFVPFTRLLSGGQEFYTKFDYFLTGIIFLSLLSLIITGSNLFFKSIEGTKYELFILWSQLISIFCLIVSFITLQIRFRLKNPVGVAQTKQINTKGSRIRKVFYRTLIFFVLWLALYLLVYFKF